MANTEFGVLLKAILDSSSIGQDDIAKIQKVLNKYHLNLSAELDDKQLLNTIKTIVPQLEKELKKITGVDIEINDKDILKAITQINKETQQAVKEQESLANAMAKGREQIELTRQAEEKRQQSAQNNAINKALEEEYNLRQKNAEQANKIQLSTDVTKLTTDYQKFGVVSQEVENNLKELKSAQQAVINAKGTDKLTSEIKKYDEALAKAKSSMKELATTQVSLSQRTSQMTSMQEWMRKNSAATKDCKDKVRQLIAECNTCDKVRFEGIKNEFKELTVQMGKAGKLGAGTLEGLITQGKKFVQWVSVSGATMGFFNEIRQSISEIKELDNILTEISKTSDMTTKELEKLGMAAYDSASKYGRTASDYLTGVQEMSRSGFYGEKGTAMAEQSLLAQAAGDMSAELANNYILATNAAYKLNGEAEKLNAVLDGQNSITNRNSVAMEDMALAMSEAGTVASSYRVSVEDLSAMIGTIESVTKLGGSEVGNGIKSILINLQNISSSKITSTLDKANASMTELVNETEQLRDPISILRDLAKTFNTLEETDPLRAEILTNIGGKLLPRYAEMYN